MSKWIALLIIASCTSKPSLDALKLQSAWKGLREDALINHPVFSSLSIQQKGETFIYQEKIPSRSKASCLALGGCMGLSSRPCRHIFTVVDHTVRDYKIEGQCNSLKDKYPVIPE